MKMLDFSLSLKDSQYFPLFQFLCLKYVAMSIIHCYIFMSICIMLFIHFLIQKIYIKCLKYFRHNLHTSNVLPFIYSHMLWSLHHNHPPLALL